MKTNQADARGLTAVATDLQSSRFLAWLYTTRRSMAMRGDLVDGVIGRLSLK